MSKKCGQYIWGLVGVIVLVAVFFRCFYGFGIEFSDEFAQSATVKRYFFGDRVLIDDWHPPTTLLGYCLYRLISFLPEFKFSILTLRTLYVIFQIAVSALLLLILGWQDEWVRISVLAYLCSTPYGIMSISYNTVAIAGFLLSVALFLSEYSPWKNFFSGILLACSVLAIPHVAIVYVIYCIVTFFCSFLRKACGIFEMHRWKWLTLGILVLFIPFCCHLVLSGTIEEYTTNLLFIIGDAEHAESGLLQKLFQSQWQVIRVYWREWLFLIIIDLLALVFRNSYRKYIFYILGCILTVYVTFRFAFVYGSVSINLMIPPLFFWGVQAVILLLIWRMPLRDFYYEIVWILAGYIFAICDFLATNTEILSMSAMFIVSALAAISINNKLIRQCFNEKKVAHVGYYLTSISFVAFLLVLRMTFVWGDSSVFKYNTRIESGIAKGIYTTQEEAEKYYDMVRIIQDADLSKEDKVLILPVNPLLYLMADSEVAAPYTSRFRASLSDLENYYETHEYKYPNKVLIQKAIENEHDVEAIEEFFISKGYKYFENKDGIYLEE